MRGKGDLITFLGVIKVTEYTPYNLFGYLIEGNIYSVIDIMEYNSDKYYLISGLGSDENEYLWYPVENFGYGFNRESIKKRYNLK